MTLNKSIIKELAQAMTSAQNEFRGLPLDREEFQQAVALAILNKFRTGELSEVENWLGVRNERELSIVANNYQNTVEDLEEEINVIDKELNESYEKLEDLEFDNEIESYHINILYKALHETGEQLAFQAEIIDNYRKALNHAEADNEFLTKDRDCAVAMYNAVVGMRTWSNGRDN